MRLEYDPRGRLIEVDIDYRITIRKVRDRWLSECGMCKRRRSFDARSEANDWATDWHFADKVHQQWTGRLVLGGHLRQRRGYDFGWDCPMQRHCHCDVCAVCDRWKVAETHRAEFREKSAQATRRARDELAARRVVPPPTINLSTGPALWPVEVRWPNGRVSQGTAYDLYGNGRWISRISALAEGGWLHDGQYRHDDAALIKAVS